MVSGPMSGLAHTAGLSLPEDELRQRAQRLGLILSDCDGVLTDTGVYYSPVGEALKRFSVRDGMGVELLSRDGVETVIVTGENSGCVSRRAEKLKIKAHLGVKDKQARLKSILADHNLPIERVGYIGDDVNDLSIMQAIAYSGGLCATPADGMPAVLASAHYVTKAVGGHGAFRDFADWILRLRKQDAEHR